MNADLHMGEELKTTGKGNLFVVFGEPDIEIEPADEEQIQVRLHGVDVFHPQTGEVRSDSADGIACWMLDTEYDGESFFVRHAYFPVPPAIPTRRSRPPSRPRSTRKPGRASAAPSPAPSPNPPLAASPSRSSTTSATR